MKKFIVIIFCIATLMGQRNYSGQMPAIGVLEGTVIDSTSSEPIEYASVSVIRLSNNEIITGGVTDVKGNFHISDIPLGRYKIVVEFIGYEKEIIESINLFPGEGGGVVQHLGQISLSVSFVQLQEIDVVGELPQIIQTIDKKIFFVDQNLSVQGGTAADVLKNIPSVDVDIDGNISIRGDQNVTVLIDGKPSGLTHGDRRAMVDNIPAAMIERVEVITNPSAKYDPDGMGGIINIILKRGVFEGMNGNTSLSVGQFNQYNVSGIMNYRKNKWNAFANASFRLGNQDGYGERSFVVEYPSFSDSSAQRNKRIRIPEIYTIKLGGDYFLNKKSTLSFSTTYSDHTNSVDEEVHYYRPLDYKIISEESDIGSTRDLDISYSRDYENPLQKLDVDVSYSFSDDWEKEVYHTVDSDGGYTLETEWETNLIIKSDYVHPFGEKTIFETGFKSTLKNFKTDLEYLETPYNFLYDEDVHAFYATLGHEFNTRWGLKIGARAEQVYTNSNVQTGQESELDTVNIFTTIIDNAILNGPYDNPYFKIYPSLYWKYTISENDQLQFGYSKRVNRPRRRTINPFPRDFFDTALIRTGNPYLKPEFSDVFELNFSHFSRKLTLNSGLYYKRTTDMIRWWDSDFIVVKDTTYEVRTSDNAGNAESHGIEFMVNYRPLPLLNMMVTLTTWNSRIFGSEEADLNGTTKGYFAFGLATLTIPRIARVELSGRYRGPMKITDGNIYSNFAADLSIQKGFIDNRLNLTLKISDVFDSRQFSIHTERDVTNELTQVTSLHILDAERHRQPRTIHLVLSYNFGKLEQRKRWGKGKRDGGDGGGMMDMDF
ncbi:MAG: TonB-dependent receptor [Candidatus Marinimicrobia bacterium]|nr:TonB-dependent receptor [Candidatus Neomarinimicrobiota bacterium]